MLIGGSKPNSSLPFARPALRTRLLHRFIFGSLSLTFVLFGAFGLSFLGERPIAGIVLLVCGGVFFVMWEVARRGHLREISGGQLAVVGDQLEVTYPALFKERLQIPLSSIAVVAVDGTPEAKRVREETGLDDEVRFPVYGDADRLAENKVRGFLWTPTDLWSREGPSPIRQLERVSSFPNLLLLFNEPVIVRETRRSTGKGPNIPRAREALGGLTVRVESPADADALFRAYRIDSRVRESDVERLDAINRGEISPVERSVTQVEARVRQGVGSGWAVLAFGLLVPFVEVWSLPISRVAWREGYRAQALIMAALALAMLAAHVVLFAQHPERQTFRWLVGIGVTALFGIVFAWHRLVDRPVSS